ncbi:phage holin family protein [Rufibacter glacialis]|uniref:Phage holin family protein n=1 Tax=Rufibacter glacialis TaxID=1259555 RepID=A0A5M8QBB4_9BACT|nr:phage holin family protein [Rufibacter glacialis]KAA6431802.1 phage holin family protein [Rufibacter glacialis]GGK81434.1 membrane protein [Rufibacter glacialis]
MGFILKIILTGFIAIVLAKFFPGVKIDGYSTAILFALVLAILNAVVRPILVILTIPITFLTLGLFLLVINAIILYLADYLLSGVDISGLLTAILFSLALSIVTAILDAIF